MNRKGVKSKWQYLNYEMKWVDLPKKYIINGEPLEEIKSRYNLRKVAQ